MAKPQNSVSTPASTSNDLSEDLDEREFTEGRYAEVRDFNPRTLTPLRKAIWLITGPALVIFLILLVVYLW